MRGLNKALKHEKGMSKPSTLKLSAHVRARHEAAKASALVAGIKAEAIQEEVEELEKAGAKLRSYLSPQTRVEFDRLRDPSGFGTPTFQDPLGKGGEKLSQGIIELAFRPTSGRFSAPQIVAVIRTLDTALHPKSVEGRDYRIPSAQRLSEWCRYLEPICHFLAVYTAKLAVRTHLSNDVAIKNHIHLLLALFRCELPNSPLVDLVSISKSSQALNPQNSKSI
jgi:hypothetical protein